VAGIVVKLGGSLLTRRTGGKGLPGTYSIPGGGYSAAQEETTVKERHQKEGGEGRKGKKTAAAKGAEPNFSKIVPD